MFFRKQIEFVENAKKYEAVSEVFQSITLGDPLQKDGKIVNVLPKKTLMLVQVAKEPISTKGPRLTTEISLAGRYVVVIPFENSTNISRKIGSLEERTRLKDICEGLRPKNVGIIVRTAAENSDVVDLQKDIQELLDKWTSVLNAIHKANVGDKLLSESDKSATLLRDLISVEYDRIWVNDPTIRKEVNEYLVKIQLSEQVKLELFSSNKMTLFEHLGINQDIKKSFSKHVNLESGSYLIIEKTEAMHVIDVNSGHQMTQMSQEDSALHINLEAATEIARQLRLRDLGGLIVVDFIDMKLGPNKVKLLNHFQACMENDRAKHSILPLSKFSLCEITRERNKPEVQVLHDDSCTLCNGTGKRNDLPDVVAYIEKKLHFLFEKSNHKTLTVFVNPYVAAYIKQGLVSKWMRWKYKYMFKSLRLRLDKQLHNHQCLFYNVDEEQLVL
jgi:ribonuclease G